MKFSKKEAKGLLTSRDAICKWIAEHVFPNMKETIHVSFGETCRCHHNTTKSCHLFVKANDEGNGRIFFASKFDVYSPRHWQKFGVCDCAEIINSVVSNWNFVKKELDRAALEQKSRCA